MSEYRRRLEDLAAVAGDLQLTRQRRKLQAEARRLHSDDPDCEASDAAARRVRCDCLAVLRNYKELTRQLTVAAVAETASGEHRSSCDALQCAADDDDDEADGWR